MLAAAIYVFNLIIAMLKIPDEVKQIALLIVGLIGLVFLVLLTVHAFQAAGGHPIVII